MELCKRERRTLFKFKRKRHDVKLYVPFCPFTAVENAAKKKASDDKSPKIVDHLTSKYVKDGEAVTLSCRIIGAKKFDVVWLHNNKEIKPSKDFQYTSEANIYKLVIAEIFPEDSGTYTCEAFNDAGESYSSCTLNVLGKDF